VESRKGERPKKKLERSRILSLILVLLLVVPVALSVLIYYLPLGDVEVTV